MRMLLICLVVCLSQTANARVYMCVDKATGNTTFTDKGCDVVEKVEEVKVEPTNLDSGKRYVKAPQRKAWNSQIDTRKTGVDYNAERRAIYENSATARAAEPDTASVLN